MSVFFYSNKKTLFHLLDPRVKILCLILFFICSVIINIIIQMFILTRILLLFSGLSKSLLSLKKILPLFLILIVMTFILWIIFYKGEKEEKIYIFNNFYIYKEAMNYSAFLTLRLLNMLLTGLLFLSITSYEDFSYGLFLLGMSYALSFTFLLSFKLVDSFINTAFLIVEAQKARGNDVTKGNIFKRIKDYTPLVIPLILTGIKKAQSLIVSLETRGFSPKNKINLKGKYRMKIIDIISLFLTVLIIILIKNML